MQSETIADLIIEVLTGRRERVATSEIISAVLERTDTTEGAIRQELTKLKRSGEIWSPKRGWYLLAKISNNKGSDVREGKYAYPAPGGGSEGGDGADTENGELPVLSGDAGLQELFSDPMQLTFYTEVRASAGGGRVTYDEASRAVVDIPRLFMVRLIGFVPPHELGVMTVDGDSMRPTLEDGDLILYQQQHEIGTGGIYVVLVDGFLMAKRIQRIGGGGYRVISDNKFSGYQDETYIPKNGTLVNQETNQDVDFRVVGRVLWPRRDTDKLHVKQVTEILRGLMGSVPPNLIT